MTDKKERYGLWLNFTTLADYKAQAKLLEAFDSSPEEIFNAAKGPGSLPPVVSHDVLAAMQKNANEGYIDKCLAYLRRHGIEAVTQSSHAYPALLKNIDDPPHALYYKGRLTGEIKLPIAVIGSRRYTLYGSDVTKRIARELSEHGACIVSGMAEGIDGIAAEAALACKKNDYPTIAVLGCGVDVIYPKTNTKLYHQIIERGAVVSEFLPGVTPEKWHFPWRNRIISGLSLGVLVIEARERSGTSITVGRALEQGRDVFSVPGRVTDAASSGSNRMIREGMAKPVFCAADILCEYGIADAVKTEDKKMDLDTLSYEQALVYKLLSANERSFDELCEMTGFPSSLLNSTLTDLEFSGIIKQAPGRIYALVPAFIE